MSCNLKLIASGTLVPPTQTLNFSAEGGTIPYVFSASVGVIDPETGVYVAPADPGLDTITVTDRFGATSALDVIIDPPMSLLGSHAINLNMSIPFQATGGTWPYTYNLVSGPGSIDARTGRFYSGLVEGVAVVQAIDTWKQTINARIRVAGPLQLLCDVIQTEMGLPDGRVWIFDQKINQPTDENLFIVIHVIGQKTLGNTTKYVPDDTGLNQVQSIYTYADLQIDVKSRNNEALFRKEEVAMALKSFYSESQQEKNSFRIFPVPGPILDISSVDGSAIPYRFAIQARIAYTKEKITAVPYFDRFKTAKVTEG